MAEMKVEHEVTLSREEVADWLADLADAIRGGGSADLPLSGPVVTVPVGEEVAVEVEIEVDGDEVELELELSWSTGRSDTSSRTSDTDVEDSAVEDSDVEDTEDEGNGDGTATASDESVRTDALTQGPETAPPTQSAKG